MRWILAAASLIIIATYLVLFLATPVQSASSTANAMRPDLTPNRFAIISPPPCFFSEPILSNNELFEVQSVHTVMTPEGQRHSFVFILDKLKNIVGVFHIRNTPDEDEQLLLCLMEEIYFDEQAENHQ